MPPRNRGPADAELLETGAQGQKHPGIVADDGVRRAPLGDRLAADLDHAGEVLTVEAARRPRGPDCSRRTAGCWRASALDLDQIPHIGVSVDHVHGFERFNLQNMRQAG